MNYIKLMMDFFNNLLRINLVKKENEDNKGEEIINESIASYFESYIDSIENSYAKNMNNYKDEIYFFYWTNIHMMRYNRFTQRFIENENIFDFNKINLEEKVSEKQDSSITNEKQINYFDYSFILLNEIE